MLNPNATKKALANSLKKLMAKKPFCKINVADIVNDCGLTRQSFYYHFKDKFDLMNWIYYTESTHLITADDTSEYWTDGLKNLCYYMQKNKTFYRNALSTTGQNSFPEYLNEHISRIALSEIERVLDTEAERDRWEFTVSFFATAFVAFIVRWSNNGMKEDPAIFLAEMRSLFDGSIQNELENRMRKKEALLQNEMHKAYEVF